jgi:SAM-dependent methyltransferase
VTRSESFGQGYEPTLVDRLGVELSARAVRRAASFEGRRLADLGCGYHATLTRSLLPRIAHATLVDVALADDLKSDPKITPIEGSLVEVLPRIASGSVDVLLCLSVLEHLADPLDALRELHRILAPGGVAMLNVPTWRGKWFLELAAFRLGVSPASEMDDHKWYFDPRDLWPLLVAAGFKPSAIRCRRHKFGLNTFAVCSVDGPAPTGGGHP